jgi:uncharacterized protein (TIGR03083 family)
MTDASDQPRSSGRRHLFKRRAARLAQDAELAVDIDLDFSECVEGIRTALAGFVSFARKAGLDAAVPTAPEWNVRQLIAHQGMVHRWSAAHLNGVEVDTDALKAEGLDSADPVLWLRDGGLRLIKTLQEAPEDVDAPVFLKNAPSDPRHFWARRQCHETTIHSVDAQSAALGRMPRAADTEVTREVSLDGIDELLRGFHTRKRSGLRSDTPLTLAIRPTDVDRHWHVEVSSEPAVVHQDRRERTDLVIEGPAEALYLALWNRTDEITGEGYEFWRRTAQVSWS